MWRSTLLFVWLLYLIPITASATLLPEDSSLVRSDTIAPGNAIDATGITMEEVDSNGHLYLFLGRFHPLLVHLPIGFLLCAFFLECATLFKRFESLKHAVPFALLLGVLSSVAAGATGYMLSTAGGYGEDLLTRHKWLGISVIGLSLTAFLLRVKYFTTPLLKHVYRGVLLLMIGALTAAGHYGGSLTHGSDYLFRYMPERMRAVIGYQPVEEEIALIQDLDSAMVYNDVIAPILGLRCRSCHNTDRAEGDLLMTSFDHLMAGGENGPVINAPHVEQSELIQRLHLPATDDRRMPPQGRRQLTRDQIKLLSWWIEQGAPPESRVTELEIPNDIAQLLFNLTEESQSFLSRTKVPPADPVLLDSLYNQGIAVTPVAKDINFLQVRFNLANDRIGRSDINLLLPLSKQVTWINLAGADVRDGDLATLPEFTNLTRLNLQQTGITDSTLVSLASLENLEYLNLYGTAVSDDGLQFLENMNNLTSLYLWQTDVSQDGVQLLKKQLPNLYVDTGWHEEEATSIVPD